MFCVECGKEGKTYDSLCAKCFLSRNTFTEIDDHIDLIRCSHCLEFLIDGEWASFDTMDEAVADIAVRSMKVRGRASVESVEVGVKPLDRNNYEATIKVVVEVEDLKKAENLAATIRVKSASCPKCSKIMGSYFESIIQVRTRGRSMSDEEKDSILNEIEDIVERASEDNRDLFISKLEELHGGFDVYLSSNSLGRSISRELAAAHGAETKESSSLVGKKEGKDVYRITFLVRLPAYQLHDVISYGGELYFVEAISSSSTRLRGLIRHQQLTLPNSNLEKAKVQARESDLLEAVVVSETEGELQVLHPITYHTFEMKRPLGFRTQGDTVLAFSHDGELYLIPH